MLAVWGESDKLVPPTFNATSLADMLSTAGNEHVTLRILPKENHFFLRREGRKPGDRHEFGRMHVSPALLELLVTWIRERVGGC